MTQRKSVTTRPRVAASVLDLVGATPLTKLNRIPRPGGATVLAKMESLNPGGSVKDRIAVAMVEDAERRGVLKPGATLVEPTSGNTGIGLAMVCAVRGYRLILTMPDDMSVERQRLLARYGAEIHLTPAIEGMTRGGLRGAGDVPRASRVLHADAVREPRQPRRPPAHDGARDPRGDRGAAARVRGGSGHRRHHHRRGRGVARALAGHPRGGGGAGALARSSQEDGRARMASRASAHRSCPACSTGR